MADTHLHDCRLVYVSASENVVQELCDEFGCSGYVFEGQHGLNLLVSKTDAERLNDCLDAHAFIHEVSVRAKTLPKGLKRLARKTKTDSSGKVDDWTSGDKIWGWFSLDRLEGRKLFVYQGETLFAETEANIFRPDLYEAGVDEGIAGFVCACPVIAPNGPRVTIRNTAGKVLAAIAPSARESRAPSAKPIRTAASQGTERGPGTALALNAVPEPAASGHYNVDLNRFSLDYFVSTGTSNRMIIFSPGFLNKDRFPYPYFQRMKWAQHFEDTCVFLTDPTLLLGNTQIGWFVGDQETHYLPVVAEYIGRLAQSRSIPAENITFFGSSAGGFSSIGFATHLRGARALAANPQTNGLKLHSPSQLANTLRSCLKITDVSDAYRNHAERFVLSEMFRKLGHVPRITIWQNFYDRYHVEHHLLPFMDEIKDLSPTQSIEVIMAARPEDGHDPPDLPVIQHLFR